jgi:predicted transcriptional regulator
MTRKPIDQLGELQRIVLEAVWDLEGGTVQEVIQHLKPKRKPAYTTVLTTLQNLTKAGWVKPEKTGRAYVYHATKSRSQAGGKSIVAFIKRAFDGNTHAMLQTLLDQEELSEQELSELRKLIDKKRKEKKQ